MIPRKLLLSLQGLAVVFFILLFAWPLIATLPATANSPLTELLSHYIMPLAAPLVVVVAILSLHAFQLPLNEFKQAVSERRWRYLLNGPHEMPTVFAYNDRIHARVQTGSLCKREGVVKRSCKMVTGDNGDVLLRPLYWRYAVVALLLVLGGLFALAPLLPAWVQQHFEVQPSWAVGIDFLVKVKLLLWAVSLLLVGVALLGLASKVRFASFSRERQEVEIFEGRAFGLLDRQLLDSCKLSRIHALQVVSFPVRGAASREINRNVTRFELNLVLEDASRKHLHAVGYASAIRKDAAILATALGVPVWDHTVNNTQPLRRQIPVFRHQSVS